MRRNPADWLIGATILAIVCTGCSATQPASWLPRCYEATGHAVSGNFLRAFDAMGGQRSLGYPITEPLMQEGRLVQYFEFARLEDHPDNPSGALVKLTMLGERMGRRRPPIDVRRAPPSSDRTSCYYSETGHAVGGDFLSFVDSSGGLQRFGFPISEPLTADGSLVQDFQHARLIWHARALESTRVTMEPSGRIYFETQRLDGTLIAPRACPPGAQVVSP